MSSHLFNVAGKNILITGGSRGIGLMIANSFFKAGANIFLTSRDANACKSAGEFILGQRGSERDLVGDVHYGVSNVGTRDGCTALAKEVSRVFNGRLHVLVNNAGTSWGEDIFRESGRSNWGFDKVLDVNVKGVFYLTRECVDMLSAGEGTEDPGRVINVGSVAGMIPQEAPTHAYDVSKAAVHHLTKKMAADLAPKGITVNCLAPGFIPSRMSDGLAKWGGEALAEKLAKEIPLRRMGNADDMAGACIYLSSKAGSWVTGSVIQVDGGTVGAMQIPLSSL